MDDYDFEAEGEREEAQVLYLRARELCYEDTGSTDEWEDYIDQVLAEWGEL